ncbi:hypothetical protein ACHAWF_018954 [Thalassiosira exigua]
MEANHDIHNRSRNRKQEHRPRWEPSSQPTWAPRDRDRDVDDADHGRLTSSLREACVARRLVEPPAGMQKRRRVVADLDRMLCAWSESLLPGSSSYLENMVTSPHGVDEAAATALLSFGSYRLGVHTPDADVDCLVLAPPHVTREDFFGSWVDILKGEERVAELHPVSSAYTPVIKFEMDSVKIDLIFARVNNSKWLTEQQTKMTRSSNDPDDDADEAPAERREMSVDDAVLVGLDETSVRSVNGVRVAQFLLDMVDGKQTRMDNFRLTLRAVKEWARVHGLYSNVLGFLGGVNWAILVCWVCKRNPDAPASQLLHLFFRTYASWKWPSPVMLSKQRHPPKGVQPLPIWDPQENYRDAKHLMPIITPCYPQMNSSYNVGEPQLRRLRDELRRASKLSEDVLSGEEEWDVLFEGNDFFKQHANYLQVNITGTDEDKFRSWFGLCESRMRLLIVGLESPIVGTRAYPFAKFYQRQEESKYIASFFIALRFANHCQRVDLGPLVEDYLQVVNTWEGRDYGMDLTMHLVSKKNLPNFVFATETPLKNISSDGNEDKTTSTPASPKRKQLDGSETSPSTGISPLKRTRIS